MFIENREYDRTTVNDKTYIEQNNKRYYHSVGNRINSWFHSIIAVLSYIIGGSLIRNTLRISLNLTREYWRLTDTPPWRVMHLFFSLYDKFISISSKKEIHKRDIEVTSLSFVDYVFLCCDITLLLLYYVIWLFKHIREIGKAMFQAI